MAATAFHDSGVEEVLREAVDSSEEEWPSAAAAPAQRPWTLRRGAVRALALLTAGAAAAGLVSLTAVARRAAAPSAPGLRAGQAVALEEEKGEKEEKGKKDEKEEKPVFKKCLCVFDIDRTLTGKQGWEDKCKKDTKLAGIPDQAYAKGTLMVSELAQSVGATFCGECYHGIVTAGQASGEGSPERKQLLKYIGGTARTRSDFWQDIQFKPETEVHTSLVVQALDTRKQDSVRSMVNWWKNKQGIDIKDEDVYFFDDIKENVQPFEGTGFNAKQVSCAVRGPIEVPGAYDGKVGGCGGAFTEVKKFKGVHTCDEK